MCSDSILDTLAWSGAGGMVNKNFEELQTLPIAQSRCSKQGLCTKSSSCLDGLLLYTFVITSITMLTVHALASIHY